MTSMPSPPYQRVGSKNAEFEKIAEQILCGKHVHRRSEPKATKMLLIKDIFANLFYIRATEKQNKKHIHNETPFFSSSFQIQIRQMVLKKQPESHLQQKQLCDDFLKPFDTTPS